jgi:hypothetical protein
MEKCICKSEKWKCGRKNTFVRRKNGDASKKNACASRKNGDASRKNACAGRKMEMQVGKMHLQEEKWRCGRKNTFVS